MQDSKIPEIQFKLDFETPKWPDQARFPLNFIKQGRTVEKIVYADIEDSEEYIIVTGFTSLSNLIALFGSKDFEKLNRVRILIGFEPNLRVRKKYERLGLHKEVKDYWLKAGLSIMQGGAVIHLIEKIKSGQVEFRFRNKLHAKLYVGDTQAVLGSSNFSYNGLNLQEEANIRLDGNSKSEHERKQYTAIKQIAESYYDDAACYNDKMIELLTLLIHKVSWQEALARAIAEMIEGNWLDEYKHIISQLEQTKLWPTQLKGLAQGVSILQNQSNVLIADPTGAGKTKLCAALVLSLQHWLFEIGKNYKTESLTICPPLVVPKWNSEFKSFRRISHQQGSMGLLSTTKGAKRQEVIEMLDLASILTIDEAHNYLSPDSKRTNLIKENRADFKILVTATPISKKVEDLLRLIELLDIDNLADEDFEIFQELIAKRKPTKQQDIQMLKRFISKFTVRRTKKILNAEIDKDPSSYHNRLGKLSRFPHQNEKTYSTAETEKDRDIAKQINDLAAKIKGVTHLTDFQLPSYAISKEETLDSYVKRRINSAKALSIYQIRAALRSSHVALVEHIEGSESAMTYFNFDGKTKASGNKIDKIQRIIDADKLPGRSRKFGDDLFPEWLIDKDEYLKACHQEKNTYRSIANLAKELSGQREIGKVKELVTAAREHNKILAFDSTVITLYYLRKLFLEKYPRTKILVATGSEKEKDSKRVLEEFSLEADARTKLIALCSDKMSESVDLQKGSCLFLLDLPSVLRIVEQRIGRIDRMDSNFSSIDIYWPEDSEDFSLKADARLIETNAMVEQIYGSNFNIPSALRGKHFEKVDSIESIIDEYKEFIDKDESWTGIHDSFQCIVELKEGSNALISEATYAQFKDVSSEIRTRVSFLSCPKDWCFIALKGTTSRSPRWYFIDENSDVHSDYIEVCSQLRSHITNDSKDLEWDQFFLKRFISIFKEKERFLLPPKKLRALSVASDILKKKLKAKDVDRELESAYKWMLEIIEAKSDEVVDFERLAEEWIFVLQPVLKKKREALRRKKKVINLNSLRPEYKAIDLSVHQITKMAEVSIIADEIDKRIAACIVGVSHVNAIEVKL